MKKYGYLQTFYKNRNKKRVDINLVKVYTASVPKEKGGHHMMLDTSKIRGLVRVAGDIDEMIFASENKDNAQTQIHSER